jgi:acetyl esterase
MTDITPTRAAEPNADVQEFLNLYNSMDIPELHELPPEQARQVQEEFATASPDVDLASVEDRTVEGPDGEVPIRVYDPREDPDGDDPLVLYFHGGGFVVGSIETHDGPCRKLAAETGYPVVSVDYRLAPEEPFPAGLKDCYASLEWAAEEAADLGADPERIVVAGDSAGGNLATAVAMLARNNDGPEIAYQVLVYPVAGDARGTEAYDENSEGYFLTAELMEWFHGQYFEDDIDQGNVYAHPRLSRDLSGLPPATVITAGYDPLRDDGATYAEQLVADGVDVSYHNFEGMIHGFFNMIAPPADLSGAQNAYDAVVADLDEAL